VWQCRFSGIEVPETLWKYADFGKGRKYSDNQAEDIPGETKFLKTFDKWTDSVARFVGAKGKVKAGKYRAFGYKAPGHRWADIKLWQRGVSMRLGIPPAGSSPEAQQILGLNKDATLIPKAGEGKKLRG
jgi:hypothetical protein